MFYFNNKIFIFMMILIIYFYFKICHKSLAYDVSNNKGIANE